MKKRWIPFIIVAMAVAFITGLRFGSASAIDTAQSAPVTEGQSPTRYFNTTIAVVNADIGTIIDGTRYNYSAAIIGTLGSDFVLVSPAMAQTGLANGTYGAIVTFPPEVSQRILSFNAYQPERVQLEFQINPDLPEREFLEVYITITELQMAINTTLASTYVSSIFRQFHEAQDQVYGVFRNTLSDLMALEIISLGDFTATLELDEMPHIPLVPRELDTVFYMEQVVAFAKEVSSWYLNSYAMASDQYLWMREGLFALTADFPEQENEWMEMLTMWTGYSVQYGELLEEYAEYVRLHEEALTAWHEENVVWHETLEEYQQQVADWHEDSNFWFNDAAFWHEEYLEYLDEAIDYFESLQTFHEEVEDNVNLLQDDITAWMDALTDYEEWLTDRLSSFIEMADIYNHWVGLYNIFLEHLYDWYEDSDEYIRGILEWKEDVDYDLAAMNSWQREITAASVRLQAILNQVEQGAAALSPFPTALPSNLNPGNILAAITPPGAVPNVPELNILPWQVPIIDTTPISIPSAPTLTGDITDDEQALEVWRQQVIVAVNDRQSEMQSAINDVNGRQAQIDEYHSRLVGYRTLLASSRSTISTWHDGLTDVHGQIVNWDTSLRSYAQGINQWHSDVVSFVTGINQVQMPEIPSQFNWEHVVFPDETTIPLPPLVGPLEAIELPDDWVENLPAPPTYQGTDIISAFNIPFPLQGNAIEPMSLERPQAFANYRVPEIVNLHNRILVDQPLSPLVGPPPRPDNFWASLEFMHGQLSSFDVGAFLSDDILRMVDQSLQSYDVFLESVRQEINFLFQDNIWLMYDIHAEYDHWLHNLRFDALDANMTEQEILQAAIDYFTEAREGTHEDTRQRLGTFAAMMPESRGAAGINQEVVDFAVMPFEFAPLGMRNGNGTFVASFEPAVALSQQQDTIDIFRQYQMIGIIALGGVFVGTVISHIVSYYSKSKQAKAEADGYIY